MRLSGIFIYKANEVMTFSVQSENVCDSKNAIKRYFFCVCFFSIFRVKTKRINYFYYLLTKLRKLTCLKLKHTLKKKK